jgi:hypothetical protein
MEDENGTEHNGNREVHYDAKQFSYNEVHSNAGRIDVQLIRKQHQHTLRRHNNKVTFTFTRGERSRSWLSISWSTNNNSSVSSLSVVCVADADVDDDRHFV